MPAMARSARTVGQDISFIERPYCEVLGTPFEHDLGAGFLSAQRRSPIRRCSIVYGLLHVRRRAASWFMG